MLVELHLRDLGLISAASVEFGPGLNVVTGETGVGKTLLVTSLALLSGARGTARLVSSGAKEAVVEAVVVPPPAVIARTKEIGLDASDELVVVRKLSADGRSRAWVGGQLAPVATLTEIGDDLIEIHGQGAGFALARPAAQIAALDSFAGTSGVLATYREALNELRALERDRERLETDERTRARETELLEYQIDEIERAQLNENEEEEIATFLPRLENSERLGQMADEVVSIIGADGTAGQLASAERVLEDAASIDATAAPLAQRAAGLAAEASELAHDVRAWGESLESEPGQLEALRERRALISSLKRKYGANVAEIFAFLHASKQRLDEIEASAERSETIDAEITEARGRVGRLASELSRRRRKAAKELASLVSTELPALALANAVFDVECSDGEETEHGHDRIEFRFSSTKKRAPDALAKVASGGELSRAMIALTLSLARAHSVPVLVFDEADQGVGGEAALDLARRLSRLAQTHQVLVVSHLAQIAAFADRHISVRRSGDEISVEVLSDDGRLAEISRMLAGLEGSDLARAHAAELLDLGARERVRDRPRRRRAGTA